MAAAQLSSNVRGTVDARDAKNFAYFLGFNEPAHIFTTQSLIARLEDLYAHAKSALETLDIAVYGLRVDQMETLSKSVATAFPKLKRVSIAPLSPKPEIKAPATDLHARIDMHDKDKNRYSVLVEEDAKKFSPEWLCESLRPCVNGFALERVHVFIQSHMAPSKMEELALALRKAFPVLKQVDVSRPLQSSL